MTTIANHLPLPTYHKTQPRIIGLTGGISTGKTTVSDYLATIHKLPVFDADIYAREAVQLGSPVLKAIAQRYGTGILLDDGHLNRGQLGNIIFKNPVERHWIEKQIHPYVRRRLLEGIQKALKLQDTKQDNNGKVSQPKRPTPIVLVVPLLFEAKMTDLVTEIWVVHAPRAIEIERLMKRDYLTEEQAMARINSQMSIDEKAKLADVVLDNSSTMDHLVDQIDAALGKVPE
jgi:dephospho-CoA kinase